MATLTSIGTYNYVVSNPIFDVIQDSIDEDYFSKWCANYILDTGFFEQDICISLFPPNGVTFTSMSVTLGGVTIATPNALAVPYNKLQYDNISTPNELAFYLTGQTGSDFDVFRSEMRAGTKSQAGWSTTGAFIFCPSVYADVLGTATRQTTYPNTMPHSASAEISVIIGANIDTNIYVSSYPIPLGVTRTQVKCVGVPELGWSIVHVIDSVNSGTISLC